MPQNAYPRPARESRTYAFNVFNRVKFTIGAKQTNTINVACQLQDACARNIAQVTHASFYLSDNPDGSTLTATATTSALAIGTNGVLQTISLTGKIGTVTTDGAGRFDINVIQTASPLTYYFVVKLPDGSIAVSGAVTF